MNIQKLLDVARNRRSMARTILRCDPSPEEESICRECLADPYTEYSGESQFEIQAAYENGWSEGFDEGRKYEREKIQEAAISPPPSVVLTKDVQR